MNPKTLLITTIVGIATTAAFGAASLRAPQIGGGATATPTTTTTARAGTMRTQTKKTSMSTSVAAPTVTASVSEPVATETTDARLSFLKGVKGFNPGKVKDTTTTQQELNSIDSRIEELQSKLDAAESAQATVLTESNIDAKITEKLTALGTSIDTKETYSKTELNNMIPTLNDRGNLTWTDPNGNLTSMPAYWLTHSYGNSVWWQEEYQTHARPSHPSIPLMIERICNKPANSAQVDCCAVVAPMWDNSYNATIFDIRHIYPGYRELGHDIINSPNGTNVLRREFETYENNALSYIRDEICGNNPETSCWAGINVTYNVCSKTMTTVFVYTLLDSPYYYNLTNTYTYMSGLTTDYTFITNQTVNDEIYEFVDTWCNGASAWCYLYPNSINSQDPNHPNETVFKIRKRTQGHHIISQFLVNYDGHIGFYTNYGINAYNNDPVAYVEQEICNDHQGLCYATYVGNNLLSLGENFETSTKTFYEVGVFSEIITGGELPEPYKK